MVSPLVKHIYTITSSFQYTEARGYCTRAINALKRADTPAAQLQLLLVQMNMEIAEILLEEGLALLLYK